MKIAGFNINGKMIAIVGVIMLVVLIVSNCSNSKNEERNKQLLEETSGETDDDSEYNSETEEPIEIEDSERLLLYSIEQQEYIKEWGFPPEGYIWTDDKELVAMSSDKLSAEDVVYGYIRNVSATDFATAGRYINNSLLITSFKAMITDKLGDTSITDEYRRKMYILALKSIEVIGVEDGAIFEDGSKYMSVKVRLLDMTNKNFYLTDKDNVFAHLYELSKIEKDSNNMTTYLCDYIYDAFSSGKVPKKEYTVGLLLSKGINKGWLIADDTELYNKLENAEGVTIYEYIKEDFNDYMDKLER